MNLYPHQEKVLNDTVAFNRVAYYLDMGLGKTYVGAAKMFSLNQRVNLIVCQKSKIQDWFNHMVTNYAKYHRWLIYDLTDKEDFGMFMRAVSDELNLKICGVINYDLLFRKPYFLQLENFTLMLDESSMIQNDSAKRTQFVLQMKPSNVILLSGTPTSGKYENLWSQIHLLGWDISKNLYNKQYVNWKRIALGGFRRWRVDNNQPYKNVGRLKEKLRQHGAVFMKTEECFDLPEQIMIPITIQTSKVYRTFQKDSIITLDTLNLTEFHDDSDFEGTDVTPRVELVGDTTLSKILYLRQLCGHYSREKLQAFKDLLVSTQDRLIVFYNFNDELDALKKIAQRLDKPVSEVNGNRKDLTAYERLDNSVTFIQYQAGAMGLNLQKANRIVYFTLTNKSELFEQSKKRIHRIGQEKPCFYYLLLCEGSIEENILQALKERKDYTDALFE